LLGTSRRGGGALLHPRALRTVCAAPHARARMPPVWIAVWGALTGLSALAAPFLGVLLAG